MQLNLSRNNIGGHEEPDGYVNNGDEVTKFVPDPSGVQAIADALRFSSISLTVTDMRYNNLDTESATMLANIAKEKRISLCGITPGQTEADFTPSSKHNYERMGPADAILLTADLASLTNLNLGRNSLKDEGVKVVCEALQSKVGTKLKSLNVAFNGVGPVGAKAVAAMAAVVALREVC